MNKEKFKVYKNVFDNATIKAIFDLMAKGIIKGIESPIKIGKESNVFSGIRKIKEKGKIREERVAIKIYRIAACDFKRMKKYLFLDPRFKVATSRRKIVLQWAKREFGNLNKAYKKNVAVPKPITVKENVIVMEFIGNKKPEEMPIPAGLLKDILPEKPRKFFLELIKEVKKLYNAGLVHSDLSEYNILNYKEKPIIIDLSHALPVKFAGHLEYLRRDIKNIVKFFSKLKIEIDEKEVEGFIRGKITKIDI